MKILISLCLISIGFISIAQEKVESVKGTTKHSETTAPNVWFKKSAPAITDSDINGKYIIERYTIQVNTMQTKKAIKAVGTELEITDSLIVGNGINTINYQINESEIMNTEDYLFRVFGEIPEEMPTDLPAQLTVHKTNNLECYGIAELPDGVLLIPYHGLLFYLRTF